MVDLDRDGRVDVLSGSLAPGDLLLFPGREEGGFGAPKPLRDARGDPLRVGRGSLPCVSDWEGDGDLDLVVGNMAGKVFLARNASGGRALSFGDPQPLSAGGIEIDLGTTNAAPCVADWDQDGRADLLLGAGDGRVLFERNVAGQGEPVLAAPVELVGRSSPAIGSGSAAVAPATRTKVAVWDWNDDGRPDLVLGDFAPESSAAPVLNAEQQRTLELAMRESVELGQRRGELERKALASWLEQRHVPPGEAWEHYEDFLLEFQQTPEARALARRQDELTALQKSLNPPLVEHGRVWVFLRQPERGR